MVLKLAEQWAGAQENPQYLATQTMITKKMLDYITDDMDDLVSRQMSQSLAAACIREGVAPEKLGISIQNDIPRRLWQYTLEAQVSMAPTLAGYAETLVSELNQAKSVLDRPWWKLLWWKVKRGKVSVIPWRAFK